MKFFKSLFIYAIFLVILPNLVFAADSRVQFSWNVEDPLHHGTEYVGLPSTDNVRGLTIDFKGGNFSGASEQHYGKLSITHTYRATLDPETQQFQGTFNGSGENHGANNADGMPSLWQVTFSGSFTTSRVHSYPDNTEALADTVTKNTKSADWTGPASVVFSKVSCSRLYEDDPQICPVEQKTYTGTILVHVDSQSFKNIPEVGSVVVPENLPSNRSENNQVAENNKGCSLGKNSHLDDQDKCICDIGYERVATDAFFFIPEKIECLSVTRTEKNYGNYLNGNDIENIQNALSTMQNEKIGDSAEIQITNSNDEKAIKVAIIKSGPDSYQYTNDGIRYYDSLLGAVSGSYSSASERTLVYDLSPYNWGIPKAGDGTLIPSSEYDLISKISQNDGGAVASSFMYNKEFIEGAYEYIAARGKYSPKDLLLGSQDSDTLIEASIPHIRNEMYETNLDVVKRLQYILDTRGQDVGSNPVYNEEGRLLTTAQVSERSVQQKIKIYAEYERIYNRYLLAQKMKGA